MQFVVSGLTKIVPQNLNDGTFEGHLEEDIPRIEKLVAWVDVGGRVHPTLLNEIGVSESAEYTLEQKARDNLTWSPDDEAKWQNSEWEHLDNTIGY